MVLVEEKSSARIFMLNRPKQLNGFRLQWSQWEIFLYFLLVKTQDDIDAAIQLLTEDSPGRKQGLMVLPLYSGLPRADQDLVFSPTPRGKRRVVISTNIAETSLTLEGVVSVVDCGFSKQRFYNPVLE